MFFKVICTVENAKFFCFVLLAFYGFCIFVRLILMCNKCFTYSEILQIEILHLVQLQFFGKYR